MLAMSRIDRRHVRSAGVLALLTLMVFLAGGATHIVARGETLGEIALEHGVTVREIVEANDIANPDLILIGQQLEIPDTDDTGQIPTPSGITHTVVRGEVLARIADEYGVSVFDVVAANSIPNPDLLHPGQRLIIPSAGAAVGDAPLYHVVQRSDSLASIAARYGISVRQLAQANGMTTSSVIAIGIQLRLTPAETFEPEGVGTIEYVVRSGDRVGDIAYEYGTTISEIVRLNNLRNANLIRTGQVLEVPARGWICPVPNAGFINDWGYPRSGGRFHEGSDLFAPRGTPVYAPVSGVVSQIIGSIGGLQFTLKGDGGATYYGTHLDSFGEDGRVSAGALVGTVGDSGNARGAKTHLHFEIHPDGIEAVNPYPTLQAACG